MDPRIASLPVVEYAQDLGVMPIREKRIHCELQSTTIDLAPYPKFRVYPYSDCRTLS